MRLLVSALVQVPTVVGWLRPVVLVPVGALGGLPAEHLEALLLHELAHIRRHDYLVNMLQSVAEALLFYHPAVWWVSGHIRAERELCCDDVAVSVSWRCAHVCARAGAVGIVPSGASQCRARRQWWIAGRPHRKVAGPVAAGCPHRAGTGCRHGRHSAGRPRHTDCSASPTRTLPLKWRRSNEVLLQSDPCTAPWALSYKPGGRMIATNAPLRLLIQFAYAVHDSTSLAPLRASQVVGGPAWIDSEGYDIEAKPEGNTDQKHAWLMLQTLLADRFRLTLHRETRELPVYDLTAKKSGFKLPAAKDVNCVSFPPGTTPRHIPGTVDCGYAPVAAVVHRAADERKEAAHGGPRKGAGNDTGPAGLG